MSRGSRLGTGRNLDPYRSIESCCDFNASPRFLYRLMMSQLCFDASSVRVNRNFGLEGFWYFSPARLEIISRKSDGHSPGCGVGVISFYFWDFSVEWLVSSSSF